MNKSIKKYLSLPYSRLLTPADDGTYTAEILEFFGCVAQGDTPAEAYEQLEQAAEVWIEASLDQGLDIPEPLMNQGFAGKVALRLPRSLHRQAARLAERDETSLNTLLVSAVAAHLGADDAYNHLLKRLEDKLSEIVRVSTANVIIHTFVINQMPGAAANMNAVSDRNFRRQITSKIAANEGLIVDNFKLGDGSGQHLEMQQHA